MTRRRPRDEKLPSIGRIRRKHWKRKYGYHRRSLAETAIFRINTIFADRVRSRSFDGRAAEMLMRCATLNCITYLGVPDGYTV